MTDTLEQVQERVHQAIAAEDNDYIEEFKLGVTAANAGEKLADDASVPFSDGYVVGEDQKQNPTRNRLNFYPHPMGGIGVNLIGSDGSVNQARLELDAAALAQTHLSALLTMMIQTAYMMQQQAAEQVSKSGLVIPVR